MSSQSIPPRSIVVVDDYLNSQFTDSEIEKIISIRTKESGKKYNWLVKDNIAAFSDKVREIYEISINIALGGSDDSVVGVECWGNQLNIGDRFFMHSDIDEYRYLTTRRLRTAIFGLIYFVDCEGLDGGDVIFDDGLIVGAKNNRCIIFFGGTRHAISEVKSGTRKTVVMSVWDEVPLAYQ